MEHCPTCGQRIMMRDLAIAGRSLHMRGEITFISPQEKTVMRQLMRFRAGRSATALCRAMYGRTRFLPRTHKQTLYVVIHTLRIKLEPYYNIASPDRHGKYKLVDQWEIAE